MLPIFLQRDAKCRVMTAFSPTQNGISNTVLRRYKKLGPSTDLFIQKQTPGEKRLRNTIFLVNYSGCEFPDKKTEHQYAGDSIPTTADSIWVIWVSSEQERTVPQQRGSSACPAQSQSLIPSLAPALGLGVPHDKHLLGKK